MNLLNDLFDLLGSVLWMSFLAVTSPLILCVIVGVSFVAGWLLRGRAERARAVDLDAVLLDELAAYRDEARADVPDFEPLPDAIAEQLRRAKERGRGDR